MPPSDRRDRSPETRLIRYRPTHSDDSPNYQDSPSSNRRRDPSRETRLTRRCSTHSDDSLNYQGMPLSSRQRDGSRETRLSHHHCTHDYNPFNFQDLFRDFEDMGNDMFHPGEGRQHSRSHYAVRARDRDGDLYYPLKRLNSHLDNQMGRMDRQMRRSRDVPDRAPDEERAWRPRGERDGHGVERHWHDPDGRGHESHYTWSSRSGHRER